MKVTDVENTRTRRAPGAARSTEGGGARRDAVTSGAPRSDHG
ncbi:hypothetical protein [Actinokineospora spheciospongiae]|nr:hypothetical protein [Actinokineospora spheciospongiae]PWW64383.1 hypothetical protein DFQ13_103357 [Actinokineospora spheciospongiae]